MRKGDKNNVERFWV